MMAVLFAAVLVVFPIFFGPGVEPPADLQFGNPSAVEIQVSNQNVTPLTDVDYTCELSKLILANGSGITDANVLIRGVIRKIPGRRATTVRCEAAYLVTAPVQAVEYKLTIQYRAYPWRLRRGGMYRIAAQVNGSGQITGWRGIGLDKGMRIRI
ncbi:MAG TPA: hypothetical protein VKV74_11125 [Bryobacteraceae bacterium]|nr:hypothetical protein [Bryobacteraceae bacterium]